MATRKTDSGITICEPIKPTELSKIGAVRAKDMEKWLRKGDLVVMDYYMDRIICTRRECIAFCLEGMDYCEGCERDRLTDIFLDAKAGELYCRDWFDYGDGDPYEGLRELYTMEAWNLKNEELYSSFGL